MAPLSRTRRSRPWLPWAKVGLVSVLVAAAGYGALELGQKHLGLQRLTVEHVSISGTRSERLNQVQRIAEPLCLGKPLFWFDAERLRSDIENLRWVRGLQIRKDPPDRLSLVIEERKPLLWLVRPNGVFLLSDDGIVMDRVNPGNTAIYPVILDGASQSDENLIRLIRAAGALRDHQKDFYDRLSELRWSERGPIAYLEGFTAPLYLSKQDVTKNIANFQSLLLDHLQKGNDLAQLRYVDLRWDDQIAVGGPLETQPPAQKTLPPVP